MPLSDTAIRAAKPREKPYKLADGNGMYLEIAPSGGRWWRLKYRIDGKEKRISLGIYPDVTLKDARERCQEARKLIASGIDPSAHRQAAKATRQTAASNSLEVVSREWISKQSGSWAKSNTEKVIARLENDVFPWLGKRPISGVTPQELLSVLRRIEERGALDTAHRVLQTCSQIFRYAIATIRAERNPAADLRGALPSARHTHYPALTDPKAFAGLLRAIDDYQGEAVTKAALRLAPLVFVRPGELRHAEWSEICQRRLKTDPLWQKNADVKMTPWAAGVIRS